MLSTGHKSNVKSKWVLPSLL